MIPLERCIEQIWRRLKPESVCLIGEDIEGLAEVFGTRGVCVAQMATRSLRCPDGWSELVRSDDGPIAACDLLIIVASDLRATMSTIRESVGYLVARGDSVVFCHRCASPDSAPGWLYVIPAWVEAFAEHGFCRNLGFEVEPFSLQVILFERSSIPLPARLVEYERHLLTATLAASTSLELGRTEIQMQTKLPLPDELSSRLNNTISEVTAWRNRWLALEAGLSWPLVAALQKVRSKLAPEGGAMDAVLSSVRRGLRYRRHLGIVPVQDPPNAGEVSSSIDVIVCIHNALEDTRRCLSSVLRETVAPYRLIIVDDGSDDPTRVYLGGFAEAHGATLIRNDRAQGYTRAANQALRASSGDFAVLLNSDTVVTPGWLHRMVACATSDPRVGLVGPLSNTASWQSIPKVAEGDDWAANALPPDVSIGDMGEWVARLSARIYPEMSFLNGFCLMIRRETIQDVGYFDEERFGPGYGEEDDYALRARKAGWKLLLCDDVYVYHAQSRSYSDARRHELAQRAQRQLSRKHGEKAIRQGVMDCLHSRVMDGIRSRSSVLLERRSIILSGREKYAGKRVLFILPVATPGGGANVVISEATAMRDMGVEVKIFNLSEYREQFESVYPGLMIPVVYGSLHDLHEWAARYDAVVATHNESVAWMDGIIRSGDSPVRAYYVQGFEPYMYLPGSPEYERALASYTVLPDLVRFAKTSWTVGMVRRNAGVDCALVGPSFETDLFCPRPRQSESGLRGPVRVAAMVRPETSYRAPKLTMELLRRAAHSYRRRVDVRFFGADTSGECFKALPRDFRWKSAGILSPRQVARFLNEVDVFLDYSEHQAMGLTALEAMGCGSAVVVPSHGGADSFVRDQVNGLIVDTASEAACWDALSRLVEDHELRQRLQRNALRDAVNFHPHAAAFHTLEALFAGREGLSR